MDGGWRGFFFLSSGFTMDGGCFGGCLGLRWGYIFESILISAQVSLALHGRFYTHSNYEDFF